VVFACFSFFFVCVCGKAHTIKENFFGKELSFFFPPTRHACFHGLQQKHSAARPTCMMENMKVSIFCLHVDFKTFCVCLFLLEGKQKKALR
jgi:hypothetical protein